MNDDSAILDAIAQSDRVFQDFKAESDRKIERLEAKLTNRPGNGGHDIEGRRATKSGIVYDSPECKAFSGYLRKGIESRELKAMDWTNPTEGGYGLPKQIAQQVESLTLRYSAMRRLSTVVQTSTGDYHHLVADIKQTGSGWVGEMAARPVTATPAFSDVAPPLGELYANPQITQQALDDLAFNAEQFLIEAVTSTFTSFEGSAFIAGTGVNQPKGLTTYPTSPLGDDAGRPVGTVQYIPTGAAAGFLATTATVSPFDVLQATLFSMRPQYRTDAAWLVSSVTMAVLAGIKDVQGRYVMQPTQVPGTPPTILGLPVYEDPWMPAIAAGAFPIALLARRGYLIVDRIPIRMIRDVFSNKPYVGLYTSKRTGGALLNSEAVKFVKIAIS